jgi:uncharacterized protein (DUF58 family)
MQSGNDDRNITEVLKRIRRIEITTRRLVNDVFSGEYHSVFKGQGMEFDEVREYQPGDEIRAIDWNVTARMGAPYIKRFMEERELVVMFLLDVSASGRFGSTGMTKIDTAAEVCALLAFSAIQNNDKVGAVMFTDDVEEYIPPDKGKKHVLHVIRELLLYQPKGRHTDIAQAISFLLRVLKRRAIVFVISDFMSPDFSKPMAMAARKFDLVALKVGDRREHELAGSGLVRVWDQERQVERVIDFGGRDARERFERHARERDDALDSLFRRHGVDRVDIDTGTDYILPLTRFFKARSKRR